MTERMDMSLDDIIKKDGIKARRPGRGAAAGAAAGAGGRKSSPIKSAGGGGSNRFQGRGGRSSAPYSRAPAQGKWQHDRFAGGRGAGGASSGPAHLLVSNLDYGVNDKDIKELFSEFGQLRKAAVHYDKSGRSLGTADVTYADKSAAIQAMKQYNGVPLDGRPMKIELAASTITPVVSSRPAAGPATAGTGGRRGGRGGGRGAGGAGGSTREPKKQVTQEELDADLDAFISKA